MIFSSVQQRNTEWEVLTTSPKGLSGFGKPVELNKKFICIIKLLSVQDRSF